MFFLADYEGVGVAFAMLIWLAATVLAWILGLAGIIAGAWRNPKRRLALWLGGVGVVLEAASYAYIWLSYQEVKTHYGQYTASHFTPDPGMAWIVAVTLCWSAIPVLLGLLRKPRA